MKGIKSMKIYEIMDRDNNISVGILLYFEKEKTFIIELRKELDEWTAPLLFTKFVKQGIYTIPRDISLLWIQERVIPSGRQNIASILKNHKMEQYDEIRLLELSHGRCSQDSLYIKKLDNLPGFAADRCKNNIRECIPLADYYMLCFFMDGAVKKLKLSELQKDNEIEKIMNNHDLFESCKIGAGGYYITFNDSIDIPAYELFAAKDSAPLTLQDFKDFAIKNLLDTTEACSILECSRQNLSYMMRKEHIIPVKEGVKGNLYLKGDVLKSKW